MSDRNLRPVRPGTDPASQHLDPQHPASKHLDPRPSYPSIRARALEHLSVAGPASLTHVAAAVGVSRPTVRRAIDDLIALDLVGTRGIQPCDRGRPAELFGLADGSAYVMGVDAGARWSRVRIVTHTGRILVDSFRAAPSAATEAAPAATEAAPAATEAAPSDTVAEDLHLEGAVTHVTDCLAEAGVAASAISHTMLSVPGMVDATGRIELSVILPAWTDRHVGRELAARVGLGQVSVENDMCLMALGEMYQDPEQPQDLVYIANHGTHRPGVVLGGVLRTGVHRMLGEGFILEDIGVVPEQITLDGEDCPYFEVARRIDDGSLDPEWLEPFHAVFARVLALLTFALDPDVLVIGGGRTTTSPAALGDLSSRLRSMVRFGRQPRLLPGSGEDASIGGAVGVALHAALGESLGVDDPPALPVRLPTPADGPDRIGVHEPQPASRRGGIHA